MLQLLNPIWLFGTVGVFIPIIIHLWNVKQTRTLKVGSVLLLGESSKQNARSLRLQDLPLLLLRCLLILIISLLLADPVWTSSAPGSENKGWILIERENFRPAYTNFKAEIDSLDSLGYELRLLAPGFNRADIRELREEQSETDSNKAVIPYWSLLRILDQQLPRGKTKAFVYTSDRLSRFNGQRPVISNPISWKTFTPADSTATWIDRAFFSEDDKIKAIISNSAPAGTSRSIVDINPGTASSPYKLKIQEGAAVLEFELPNNRSIQQVAVDSNTLNISIYSDKFGNDAGYLEAAVEAIQKYTSRRIKLSRMSSEEIPAGQDLIFWLSEKKFSSDQQERLEPGSSLFIYAAGKPEDVNSWMLTRDEKVIGKSEPVALYKRISYPENQNSVPVWEDGFGRPVLELKNEGGVFVYRFYSRLNPQWTDLVWQNDFTKMLLPIVIPQVKSAYAEKLDRRTINEDQIISGAAGQNSKNTNLIEDEFNLNDTFWLLIVIVFFCERFITYRNDLN